MTSKEEAKKEMRSLCIACQNGATSEYRDTVIETIIGNIETPDIEKVLAGLRVEVWNNQNNINLILSRSQISHSLAKKIEDSLVKTMAIVDKAIADNKGGK